jgi:hypothetical protein
MRKPFVLCCVILFANTRSFAESQPTADQDKSPKIYVLVYNYALLTSQLLSRAEEQANQIFRRAGVQIVWVDQASLGRQPGQYSLREMDLILRVLPEPRATLSNRTALGEALPCHLGPGPLHCQCVSRSCAAARPRPHSSHARSLGPCHRP